ncbi:MAG: efflux RND transporter periplasmic adaptor subunit [Burkholderiaceae bacterium]
MNESMIDDQPSPHPMTQRPARPARRLAAVALLAIALAACGKSADKPAADAAKTAAPPARPDPMIVEVDKELAERIAVDGIVTEPFADSIRIAGRLELNQYRTARIGAPVTGRITSIAVVVGQPIKTGQTLAELSSSELTSAQLSYLRAHSQEQLMSRAVERAELLLASDVIGSAELQRRENELTIAKSEKRASADQLRLLGLSQQRLSRLEKTGQIQPAGAIAATSSGTLIERNLALGQVVNPTDALFVVSDLSTVWAAAEVPEQDAQFVRPGQIVEVEIPALDNQRVAGKVALVADVVNPETRTVRVTVDLNNADRALKPSMLITMLIQGRSVARPVLPAGAVVREDDHDYVFVEIAPNRFRMTPVTVGPERDGKRPLMRPLPADARIVTRGAFHLNNVRELRNTSSS